MSEIHRPNPEAHKEPRESREKVTTFDIKDSEGRTLAVCESTITAPDEYGESRLLRCVLISPDGKPIDLLESPEGRKENVKIYFTQKTHMTDGYHHPGVILVNRDFTNIADIAVLLHELGHDEQYYSSDGFSETWKVARMGPELREDYSRRFKDLASRFSDLLLYHEMQKRNVPMSVKVMQEAEDEFNHMIAKFYEVFQEDKRQSDHIKETEGRGYLDYSDEDIYTEGHIHAIEELTAYAQEMFWQYPGMKKVRSDRVLWFERDASQRARRRLTEFVEQGIDLRNVLFPLTEREIASAKEYLEHASKERQRVTVEYLSNPNKTISERLDFAYNSYECIHTHA